jgi:hypothetical protein
MNSQFSRGSSGLACPLCLCVLTDRDLASIDPTLPERQHARIIASVTTDGGRSISCPECTVGGTFVPGPAPDSLYRSSSVRASARSKPTGSGVRRVRASIVAAHSAPNVKPRRSTKVGRAKSIV